MTTVSQKLRNKNVRLGLAAAMVVAGFGLLTLAAYSGRDEFPGDLIYVVAWFLVIFSSPTYRFLGEEEDRRQRRRGLLGVEKARPVFQLAAAVVAFYLGVVFSKLWSAGSVTFIYHYMWIAVVPAAVYLIAVNERVEKTLKKEFGSTRPEYKWAAEDDDENW